MPTTVHDFDWPDRVVVGTVGVPGQRTFYLQARAGKQLISIAMEKLQADQLAEKIDEILDQLMTIDGNPFHVPANTPLELVDNDDLDPVEEQFRAGVMSLGWDPTTAQVVIEAYPIEEVDEDDDGFLEERRTTPTPPRCCGCGCRWAPPAPSRSARGKWWAPGVRSA